MKITCADKILQFVAFLCLAAVGFALVSQYAFDMRPCAWCVLQRLILLAIAAVCILTGTGWGSAWVRRLGAALAAALSISGIVAAWYQYTVASQAFSCAQTFADTFITQSGLDAALPWLFGIYATCADARVSLLGMEYALWGLLLFVVSAILTLWVLLRRARA
ncbi:disulfide bond formation protein B [Castellaniella sp.]|uniref:disulfide bond formation protein B n=1 Tax=Castellaniella sp. TaxID=1955812 RepID=UPI002AFEB71A|nr:disulfide bond formation protein B [Castellaniella sp.]